MTAMPSGSASAPAFTAARVHEYALLGMLASGYFAVLGSGELDPLTAVVTLAALCLRGLMIAGVVNLEVPAALVAAATVIYAVFYAVDYLYISADFLTATVHMIFFVTVVKVLTARTPRDHTYIKVIATLELLAAAMLSVHVSFFVFLAAFLLFTIAALASGEVAHSLRQLGPDSPAGRPVAPAAMLGFPRRLSILSLCLFGGIIAMTAVLFFVLPRTARAALQRFAPESYHLPGFADEVTLGEIGEIKQNSAPVMHIRPYGRDGLLAVRWRGAALASFDGKRWFNPPAPGQPLRPEQGSLRFAAVAHARPGLSIRYEVQLNDIASDTLFFAGTPESISIQVPLLFRSPSGSLSVPRRNVSGLRYGAYSFVEDETALPERAPRPLDPSERAALLDLPDLDPRVAALAADWTAGLTSPAEMARAIEYRLRSDYGYTLDLGSTAVADPVAHFLLVRRQGHCEYFASSMAVMLRAIGIPARVVTGFLSGVYNPMTGWQIVRASDAHTWVEAWLPGSGWTTFDPTPPDPSATPGSLWSQAALLFDAADQFWRDWVVGYDFEHQLYLASQMQDGTRRLRFAWMDSARRWFESGASAGRAWAVEAAAAAVLGIGLLFWGPGLRRWAGSHLRLRRARRGEAHPTDATLLYERMLALLARRGFHKSPWSTPAEFARVLPPTELAILVEDLTAVYNQVRFGGRSDAAPRMVRLLSRIESLLAA
jgi:transglutaminase-like putative cysteine protease